MLTARKVVLTVVTLAILSILSIVASAVFRSFPDTMADSFGSHSHGYLALYEILDELGYRVERSIGPPTHTLKRADVLLMLGPHLQIAENEPAYLHQVRKWVEDGGKVIVTPDVIRDPLLEFRKSELLDTQTIKELGIKGVEVDTFLVAPNPTPPSRRNSDIENLIHNSIWGKSRGFWTSSVIGNGNLKLLETESFQLQVPKEDLKVFLEIPENADGTIQITDTLNKPRTLVASFPAGKGSILIVSDPGIFSNHNIAAESNPVLAARIIGGTSKTVVIDEFYHGLTIRGNPFALLGRLPFGLLACSVLLVTGLWAWRNAVHLGPPLPHPEATRRDVMEYVDAMARFLMRSRGSNRFVLDEVRQAALRVISEQLGLAPGSPDLTRIQLALSRRSPSRLKELDLAVDQIDQLRSQSSTPDSASTLQAIQRISNCHSK